MSTIALTLSGSGFIPSAVMMVPRYLTSGTLNCNLLKLKWTLRSLALSKTWCKIPSCSCAVEAAIMILSVTMRMPDMPSNTALFFFCSLVEEILKGHSCESISSEWSSKGAQQ